MIVSFKKSFHVKIFLLHFTSSILVWYL